MDAVRDDFDRLARLGGCDGAGPYDPFLVGELPARCGRALEIGCGAGAFTRRLAERVERVVAIDFSPEMARRARARLPSRALVAVADAAAWPFSDGAFDCAVAIAVLHHLPLEATLANLARAVRPGGLVLAHDLLADDGPLDLLRSAVALAAALPARLAADPALRAAWRAHAAHDRFSTEREVRHAAARALPGARFTRHLRRRYTLVWRRPPTII